MPERKGRTVTQNLRCNEQIRISPVFVIGPNNEQIGPMDTREALRLAYDQGLDLVEVAPHQRPPVCRIMDYGKWKYHQKKNIRRPHEQQIKEVRLRPKTDAHDRQIKIRRALEFLRKGDKVQFRMVFRGRERAHRNLGVEILAGIIAELGDLAKVEKPPSMEGAHMTMIVAPNKAALERQSAPSPTGAARPAPSAPAPPPAPARPKAATPDPTAPAPPGPVDPTPVPAAPAPVSPAPTISAASPPSTPAAGTPAPVPPGATPAAATSTPGEPTVSGSL